MADLAPEDINRLKLFTDAVKSNPQLLDIPELKFFRDYIESLGGKVPTECKPCCGSKSPPCTEVPPAHVSPPPEPEPEVESEESDVDIDNDGVIEGESEELPPLGDVNKVPTEEDMDAADVKRTEAMIALSDGDFASAVDIFTEAIILNPSSAMMYAKRASILIKQKRPNAAIRDCDEALKLNPDSAIAYKFRGRAYRLLGKWLEAAKDLRLACKLDYDEQANEWLKEVTPNASVLEEHERKYRRKREEKEICEKRERIKKAQEEAKKEQEKQKESSGAHFPEGFPGGMPGGPRPEGMPDISSLFSDPEILTAMQDPEVAAAFQDVSSNPQNIFKYQSNPKVSNVINKLISKFGGGAGGMGGGFPGGGAGGMGGGFPGGGSGFPGGMGGGFPDNVPKSGGDDLD